MLVGTLDVQSGGDRLITMSFTDFHRALEGSRFSAATEITEANIKEVFETFSVPAHQVETFPPKNDPSGSGRSYQ